MVQFPHVKALPTSFSISRSGIIRAWRPLPFGKADIPAPDRSYWAKLRADKKVVRQKLSPDQAARISDLSEIIFGTRTTSDDKLKIMKIVEEKCRAESRSDFEFHQMQYLRDDAAPESHRSLSSDFGGRHG